MAPEPHVVLQPSCALAPWLMIFNIYDSTKSIESVDLIGRTLYGPTYQMFFILITEQTFFYIIFMMKIRCEMLLFHTKSNQRSFLCCNRYYNSELLFLCGIIHDSVMYIVYVNISNKALLPSF